MICIIKHIKIEGPGSMLDFLEQRGYETEIIELEDGQSLPQDFARLQAVIILGGPMNVYEEEKYPFLKDEDIFIKKAAGKDIPVIGICLGAQLISKALGGEVKKAKDKEIGWHKVSLDLGKNKDSLLKDIAESEIEIFQWHEDEFSVPEGSELLAFSSICPQVFRYDSNVYGFQFHFEVTEDMIKEWMNEYKEQDNGTSVNLGESSTGDFKKRVLNLQKLSASIMSNFVSLIPNNA